MIMIRHHRAAPRYAPPPAIAAIAATREPELVYPKRHSARAIAERVAFEMGVPIADVMGERRLKRICRVRFASIWVIRRITALSLPQIGRAIGGRDHSTILNAIARAEDLRARDPAFRALTNRIAAEFAVLDEEEADETRL